MFHFAGHDSIRHDWKQSAGTRDPMNTEGNITRRVGLLGLALKLGNVAKACRLMGFSRDSFYRLKALHENGGWEPAIEQPAFGQVRVPSDPGKRGLQVSPVGVRTIWMRHDLQTLQSRLKALSVKVAQEGLIPTEDQVRALEKSRQAKQTHGEMQVDVDAWLQTYNLERTHPVDYRYDRDFNPAQTATSRIRP